MHNYRAAVLRGAAAIAVASAIASATPASAQEQAARSFDIPAGSLGSAIARLGRQANVMITVDPAQVRGRRSSGLRGSYTLNEAIDALLAGSGLAARPDGKGGFILAGVAPAGSESESAEIVVTGQFQNSLVNRLPIKPRELPYSLNVIDRSKMEERGFINPLDILETLPNVVRRQTQLLPTGGSYLIRGLFATVLTNNRPENDSRGAGRRDMSQIERIEVIKGPASILLGPVIPGGAVNQVTKTPQKTDFVDLTARGGSYGTYRVEADANTGSLFGSDILSGRITFAYEDQRSPQDPEKTQTFSVRPVIEANFTDRTRMQASVAYTKRDSVPGTAFPVNTDGSVPDTITAKTFFGVPAKQDGKDVYADAELQHEFLDDLKLVIRGSYQDSDFDYQASQVGENYTGGRGFSPGDTLAEVGYSHGYRDTQLIYGDVQLVGGFDALGQRQDWVIGGSIQKTKFDSYFSYGGVLGRVDINNITGAVYRAPDFTTPLAPFSVNKTSLHSVYAETNLRPIDRMTIVAGVRYDDYKITNRVTGVATPSDDVTFRVGASYELVDNLNAYVSYAESFIP